MRRSAYGLVEGLNAYDPLGRLDLQFLQEVTPMTACRVPSV